MKTIKKDIDHKILFLRKGSVIAAYYLNKIGVSPNTVTLIRVFVFGTIAFFSFLKGTYVFNMLGVIILFVNFFFDLVDGDLARNYNKKTRLGVFLDKNLDLFFLNIILLGITLNLLLTENSFRYIALLALFGQPMSLGIAQIFKINFGISSILGNKDLEKSLVINKSDKLSIFLKELLTPRTIFSSLLSSFRYYVVMGGILNILPIAISIYAIVLNIRWLLLSLVLSIYYSNSKLKEKFLFFRIMKSIENKNLKSF